MRGSGPERVAVFGEQRVERRVRWLRLLGIRLDEPGPGLELCLHAPRRLELGREVASLIPGATLIPLPGSSHLYYHGDWPPVLEALLGFLCQPVSTGPQLTNRELEVAGLVAFLAGDRASQRITGTLEGEIVCACPG